MSQIQKTSLDPDPDSFGSRVPGLTEDADAKSMKTKKKAYYYIKIIKNIHL